MKLQILLLTAIFPAAMMATEPVDTMVTKSNKKVIVNDSDGNVTVKVFKDSQTEIKPIFEGRYSDDQEVEQYFSSPFIPRKKRSLNKSFNSHFPTLIVGFNELSSSFFGSLNNDDLHVRSSKSWEWGLGLASCDFSLNASNTLGVTINAQLINIHNHFQGNWILTTDNTNNTYLREETNNHVRKSYLSYWELNIPVLMEYQYKIGHNKLYMALGPGMEIRKSEHSRYFIDNNKYTETSDVNLNPIGFNIQGYCGYGDMMIYFRSAITPLLNSNKAPKCFPVSIGLGFSL